MSHIFVSYIEQDNLFARHFKRRLQSEGFTVWMDETGDEFNEDRWLTIETNIYSSAAYVLIMTSQAQKSSRVRRELQAAHQFEKPIFPVLLEEQPWIQVADLEYFDMTAGVDSALPLRLVSRLVDVAPMRSPSLVLPLLPDERGQEPVLVVTDSRGMQLTRNRTLARSGIRALVLVVIVGLIVLLTDMSDKPDQVEGEPVPTAFMLQSTVAVSSRTETQYLMQVETNTAHTQAALTAVSVATLGTATPTIHYRGTIDARFTATRMAEDAQLAQAALVMSATAAVQMVSVTPTSTPPHIPVATATSSAVPVVTIIPSLIAAQRSTMSRISTPTQVHSAGTLAPTPLLTSASRFTPAPTTMAPVLLTQIPAPSPTATPDAVAPNGWNAGTILIIQETSGMSQYAGQEPNRPEQFQPGDEVIIGLGSVAPGQMREWYVVPPTQERWWFIDCLGGGWLPESVLGETAPAPDSETPTETYGH